MLRPSPWIMVSPMFVDCTFSVALVALATEDIIKLQLLATQPNCFKCLVGDAPAP